MKKYGKRIAAFALSVVVALGSVCYNPPKANAAIIEGMVANMFLSSYMTASGISLVPDDATVERLGYALEDLIPDFVTDYAAEVGEFTVDMFNSVIEQNCVIQTTGILQIAHQAAALMGRFTGWLIDKFGLIGEDGTPVTTPIGVVPSTTPGSFSYNGMVLPDIYSAWTDKVTYPYAFYHGSGEGILYVLTEPVVQEPMKSGGTVFLRRYSSNTRMMRFYIKSGTNYWQPYGNENGNIAPDGIQIGTICKPTVFWSNHDILNRADSTVFFNGTSPKAVENWEEPVLSVSLSSDYVSAPNVGEQYSMLIDTGIAYEDDETYINAVMGGAASGTLSTTYTIEETTTGDVVVPEEDDESGGILNWVKRIWQSVQDIPKAIADAVANVFVPSAEYMAALPATVTATFDNRTGFLTYPVSVLYGFADKLSAGSQDFILEWPTVNEPYSGGQLMPAGQFNVSKYVRDNDFASDIYTIYQWVMGGYLTFLFLGLCRRKYNSVIGDRLGG